MFGYTVALSSTPYTMAECDESLEVLKYIPEVESSAECIESATRPTLDTLPPNLMQKILDFQERLK